MTDVAGRVYTSKDGHDVVYMKPEGHGGPRIPVLNTGWRATSHGTRELVHWKNSQWMSDKEINTARVAARTFNGGMS